MNLCKTQGGEKLYSVNIPRVKGKMAERGYNITTLAHELGISRNTLSSYLSNPATMPYDKMSRIAELLCDDASEAANIFLHQTYVLRKKNDFRKELK